ncbi:NepR family anti-sigma factor [uncultured Tateyamaria sp.]|uniref:NepR family anti-sigma factor n=1 Tax=uncultured Tateyamaria sp. TaxID=455651 RepID=UPI00261CCBB6|nr:NepR family anti-sigma factor [uncultured Tateyamaria sp.]
MITNKRAETSQTHIQDNLRRAFRETVDDDVPDRFKALLDKFRDQSFPVTSPRDAQSG